MKGETMSPDAGLSAEKTEAKPPVEGVVRVTRLGQSGFALETRLGRIVIDPYLSDSLTRKYAGTNRPHERLTPIVVEPSRLGNVDLVLVSHKHGDHFDPETSPAILSASPEARLILPASLVDHALAMNLDRPRLIPLDAGDVHRREPWTIRAIPSAHEGLDRDDQGRYLYLGFVITIETGRGVFRVYHSGDTLAYSGLDAWLGEERFDVLFLPINGRDEKRGVPGNMNSAEAVALAARVGPRFLVPHHYDMFKFNSVPIGGFEAEARALPAGVSAVVLDLGSPWDVEVQP